jgi:hypothetical protein
VNRIESNGHDLPPGGVELHPEIVMWTTFKGHFYLHLPTRTWMKGLTRILGNLPMEEGLTRWIANQGSYDKYLETLEKAKKRGTAVHQGIEALLAGDQLKMWEFEPEARDGLEAFCNFWQDYGPDTAAVEQPIWDIRRKIATKLDWRGGVRPPDKRGKDQGEMLHTYLDFKTSSGIWESAILQAHEGAWIYNECMPHDEHGEIEQVGIVRLGSQHKRGYEYQATDITVEKELHAYKHKIANCLLWIEHSRNPQWEPEFKPMRPKHLQLPSPSQNGEPEPAGNGKSNGRH